MPIAVFAGNWQELFQMFFSAQLSNKECRADLIPTSKTKVMKIKRLNTSYLLL